MTKIILCRHGHVEGIKPERFRGRTDLPLTSQGKMEAQALAQKVASTWKPAAIYTSPMQRCVETGGAIAAACGIAAHPLNELNDIDYGDWQFKTYAELQKSDPKNFVTWFSTPQYMRFPNGESLQDVAARSANLLRFILNRHAGSIVVLVGHDSINRVLLLQCLGLPLSSYWLLVQEPCCVNEFDMTDKGILIRHLNETCHLEGYRAAIRLSEAPLACP
jgi:broad specificity phosphatase PhoE